MKRNINSKTDRRNTTVYTVSCMTVCGFIEDNGIYIDDVFPITDIVTDRSDADCKTICAEFFDDIVKELKLRENKKCVVNEEDKEIFIIRSDGMFVLAHDFNCSSERVDNIPEWFVKNHIEKRLVDFVNQTQK